MMLQAVPQTGAKLGHQDSESVVWASRARARRRWILKATSSLLLSALVLALLIVLRRDRVNIDECIAWTNRSASAIQASLDELGQLPATLPDTALRGGFEYASPIVREYARQAAGPVIIGNSPFTYLMLRADGIGVVLCESGKVRCEWWDRTDFVRQYRAQTARIQTWDENRRAALPQLP